MRQDIWYTSRKKITRRRNRKKKDSQNVSLNNVMLLIHANIHRKKEVSILSMEHRPFSLGLMANLTLWNTVCETGSSDVLSVLHACNYSSMARSKTKTNLLPAASSRQRQNHFMVYKAGWEEPYFVKCSSKKLYSTNKMRAYIKICIGFFILVVVKDSAETLAEHEKRYDLLIPK